LSEQHPPGKPETVKPVTEQRAPFCFPCLEFDDASAVFGLGRSTAAHAEGQKVTVSKDTIRRWRREAADRRAAAVGVTDPQARIGLLNAARSYDELADHAETFIESAADERSDAD